MKQKGKRKEDLEGRYVIVKKHKSFVKEQTYLLETRD